MQIKKKLAVVAIVAAVLVGASAPVSASGICDMEAISYEMWVYQLFVC